MANKSTVFVVDDDPGALRSLCWLIRQADLPVRAFRSGWEFLNSYRTHETGCLILDVRMPEMNGLEVQQRLGDHGIGLPIIFITAHGDVPTCRQAFRGGAFDFLEKPVDDEVLLDHIKKAFAQSEEHIIQDSAAEFNACVSRLTPREKEVFDMLISGKSLKEIAIGSNVTIQTIWRHRLSIFQKMGVENDVELVRFAMQCSYKRPQ
jgi:two-component system, LuxR family, response regulator FixJ